MKNIGKARSGLMGISILTAALAAACSTPLETQTDATGANDPNPGARAAEDLGAPEVKRLPISDADAERHLKARVDRHARIDQLKDLAVKTPNPAVRDQAMAEVARLTVEAAADTEGLLETPETPPAREPEQLNPEQKKKLDRLLARMAQFDMKDPAQAAEWNRVKHEEFEK
jgi:hypothetical protein